MERSRRGQIGHQREREVRFLGGLAVVVAIGGYLSEVLLDPSAPFDNFSWAAVARQVLAQVGVVLIQLPMKPTRGMREPRDGS